MRFGSECPTGVGPRSTWLHHAACSRLAGVSGSPCICSTSTPTDWETFSHRHFSAEGRQADESGAARSSVLPRFPATRYSDVAHGRRRRRCSFRRVRSSAPDGHDTTGPDELGRLVGPRSGLAQSCSCGGASISRNWLRREPAPLALGAVRLSGQQPGRCRPRPLLRNGGCHVLRAARAVSGSRMMLRALVRGGACRAD
jgi:hypothetical protein